MLDPLSFGPAAGRVLARLGWRRVQAALLPPTVIALADSFSDACASVDQQLGSGFGDTLSSALVGHDADLDRIASVLVAGDLAGVPDLALRALDAELDFEAYNDISGTDTATFLQALMSELRVHVERRAAGAGSPLANWYTQLQMAIVISITRETRDSVAATVLSRPNERALVTGSEQSDAQPWYVPVARTPWFYGREDSINFLVQQADAITAGPPASLSGMGGLGKTQTALQFAHRYRRAFSAVFLVRAGSETRIRSGLADIASRLRLPNSGSRIESELIALTLEWLDTTDGWLLIYDGADIPSILAPYLPRGELGRVIITSRADCGELSALGRCLRLAPMTDDESTRFLMDRAQLGGDISDADYDAAVELTKLASGLPLAIEQMGAYLAESRAPMSDYVASLRVHGVELLKDSAPRTGDYAQGVSSTWSGDVKAVQAESPAALELLKVTVFWSPERVPIELIVAGRDELPDALREYPGLDQPLGAYRSLRPLQRYSLIQLDPGLRSYSLHPLLHEAVRYDITEGRESAYARHAARALQAAFPSASFENWPLCSALIPHVQRIDALVAQYDLAYDDVGALLNEAASFLRIRGDYVLSEEMHLKTLALARNAGIPDRISTSLNNLACVYVDVDEPKRALSLFREALQISRDHLGEDNPELWLAYHNLARTCLMAGLKDEAHGLIERALTLAPSDTEDDLYFRAFVQATRAEILCAMERSEEAAGDAEDALEVRNRSGNLQRIAASYSTLGLVQCGMGDVDGGLASLEKALEISEGVYGATHPILRVVLDRLSDGLRLAGREDEAIGVEARSAELSRRLTARWHADRSEGVVRGQLG